MICLDTPFVVNKRSSIKRLIPTIHPISGFSSLIILYGRLMTGHWIIPDYDKVFLSPLIVGGVLLISNLFATAFPELISINAGITTVASVFLTIILTPDLDEWRLTGNHRIHPGFGINKTELVQTQ